MPTQGYALASPKVAKMPRCLPPERNPTETATQLLRRKLPQPTPFPNWPPEVTTTTWPPPEPPEASRGSSAQVWQPASPPASPEASPPFPFRPETTKELYPRRSASSSTPGSRSSTARYHAGLRRPTSHSTPPRCPHLSVLPLRTPLQLPPPRIRPNPSARDPTSSSSADRPRA